MYIRNDEFTGFTFNGIHSSTLGIYRVSESNRHTYLLTPSIKDTKVDVPGTDFDIYFNTKYGEYEFEISIAFADLTELQFRRFSEFYKTKSPFPLIFDENPYKVYMAKGSGAVDLKYVSFENDGKRWYGGEAKLKFVCRTPYAFSRFNFLDNFEKANLEEWQQTVNDGTVMQSGYIADPTDTSQIVYDEDADGKVEFEDEVNNFINKELWEEASDIQEEGQYNKPYVENGKVKIKIYNSGDVPMPISIRLRFIDDYIVPCALSTEEDPTRVLTWNGISRDKSDTKLKAAQDKYVNIDTNINSVNGEDESYRNTYRSYLQYFSGNFITAPIGETTLVFSTIEILPYIDGVFYRFRYL